MPQAVGLLGRRIEGAGLGGRLVRSPTAGAGGEGAGVHKQEVLFERDALGVARFAQRTLPRLTPVRAEPQDGTGLGEEQGCFHAACPCGFNASPRQVSPCRVVSYANPLAASAKR